MVNAEFLAQTELFRGCKVDEIVGMLDCLGARERSYEAGQYVFRMGETIHAAGVVLAGKLRIESVDAWGNTSVLGIVDEGGMVGEAYAAADEPLMVDVVATEPTELLFVSVDKVLQTCVRSCPYHARASANLVGIIARKNLLLSRRIFHTAPRTIRGKVIAYLSDEAKRAGSRSFDIPFNRQELADYLDVNRSALSAELSRMSSDGLITTRKSHFELLA